MAIEYTPENITELKPNEIFVFGSNTAGQHIGGAARVAYEKFGAKWGKAEGLSGQTYAIPTINYYSFERVSEEYLKECLVDFIRFCRQNKDKKFYLTKIGCGIAGWEINEMKRLFTEAMLLCIFPDNLIVPKEFVNTYIK